MSCSFLEAFGFIRLRSYRSFKLATGLTRLTQKSMYQVSASSSVESHFKHNRHLLFFRSVLCIDFAASSWQAFLWTGRHFSSPGWQKYHTFSGGEMGAHGSNLDDILAEDMHHWYNKFMKESPSGLITLFELKAMLEMKGMTDEAGSYVDQVFFTFDMDGDGYIDFVEYIAAVSLLLKGEINQKLKWYFKLFDQDGNGKIDKDEMETIFKAIQDITRSYEIPPEDIVTLVYEKIDVNGEGELTLEEFIEGAKDHPDIMEMLTKMMDLTNVLEIIVNGQRKCE